MKQIIELLNSNVTLATALTAIAALFVSFLSIVLTTVSLWMQRTHNRKSFLPIGYIAVGDYEDDILVRLRNDGNGPLIVESMTVFPTGNQDEHKSSIIAFMPDLPGDYAWTTFVSDIKGSAISPAGHITLIELKGDPGEKNFEAAKEIVRNHLALLSVTIAYRNVYNDRMPLISRRLNWFQRSE